MIRRAGAPARLRLAFNGLGLGAWLALVTPGCGHHVEPTDAYRTPESIPAPRLLTAEPGCYGIAIQWYATDRDFEIIEGWHVYKQRPNGEIVRLTPRPTKQRLFVDDDEPEDGDYRYWATAMSRGGVESLRSNDGRFHLRLGPPDPPTGLSATAFPDRVVLQWQRGSLDLFAGYRVYRNGASIGFAGDADMPAYVDTQVRPGETYRYAVRAADCRGTESVPTAEISVSIPNPSAAR